MSIKYIAPETIEQIANQMRSDLLPVPNPDEINEIDIYRIAHGLGCKIELVDFDPPNISAKISRNSPNTYIIQVCRSDSLRRQKFSIAHEIAHIILHDDGQDEFIEFRQNSIDYSPNELYKEVQANMLASALLLPKQQVTRVWEMSKSIDTVADIFNVSKD